MAYAEKYYTELYQTCTLHEAIERAAKIDRETSIQYPYYMRNIPINVRGNAWKRGIRLGTGLLRNAKQDALLIQDECLEAIIKLKTVRLQLLKAFHICEFLCHLLDHKTL